MLRAWVASAVVALVLLDLGVRAIGVERRIVDGALYYQASDLPIHRDSDDRFLHYELRPSSELPLGQQYPYRVHINRLGQRGPERDERRVPGVMRVLAFGGSTLYGFHLDDDATLPARLEASLDALARGARRHEVWNYGTCAYTLAQAAHLAERELATRDPDLVLVQLYNTGRRPFLLREGGGTVDFRPYLDDADAVRENFPAPRLVPWPIHLGLMRVSAAWRVAAGLARRRARSSNGGAVAMDGSSIEGDAVSLRAARSLVDAARARGVPVVFVSIPANRANAMAPVNQLLHDPAFDVIDLHQEGREPSFYDAHPPAPTMGEWADTIAAELARRGLLHVRERR
jgi:hypothetical protein